MNAVQIRKEIQVISAEEKSVEAYDFTSMCSRSLPLLPCTHVIIYVVLR